MSWIMFKWIVQKKNPTRIERNMRRDVIFTFAASGVVSFTMLGLGYYGSTQSWCWITSDNEIERFYSYYLWLIISWAFTLISVGAIRASISFKPKTISGVDGEEDNALTLTEKSIQDRLAQYIYVFVLCWGFGLLSRAVEGLNGKPVYATTILQVTFVPLQGMFNCLIYVGVIDRIKNKFCRTSKNKALRQGFTLNTHISMRHRGGSRDSGEENTKRLSRHDPSNSQVIIVPFPSGSLDASLRPMNIPSSVKYIKKNFSIFCTTLNLGEAPIGTLQKHLDNWILLGHDIYSIGVQECLELASVRELIWAHLGGPGEFQMFGTEIGSDNTRMGYHGYIALTAFIRTRDFADGSVRPTITASKTMATGANLVITTAQNKGAVGLPFQIHDTSIAFVTAHLPSDSWATCQRRWNRFCVRVLAC